MNRALKTDSQENDSFLTESLCFSKPTLRFSPILNAPFAYEGLSQDFHFLKNLDPLLFFNTNHSYLPLISSRPFLYGSGCCIIGMSGANPRENEPNRSNQEDPMSLECIAEDNIRKSQSQGLRKRKKSGHHSS